MISKPETIELIHGSGNVFADFGHPNADTEQAKAILAANIIAALDERNLTQKSTEELTGVPASDISQIRKVKLDGFTFANLMSVLERLRKL